jgi:hypothetical protein
MYNQSMIRMTTKKGKLKMKSVVATMRFVVGDIVSWKSKSGNEYKGSVVGIKEGFHDDLIVVEMADGQHRSFYDNATNWWIEA